MPSTMVPIELEDEAPDPPPPHRSRLGRRTRWWVVAVAVAAVPALLTGQWTADRLERASWDGLSDRANVLPPLGRTLTARWSVGPAELVALAQGTPWRGTVVGPVSLRDGSVAVAAIDDRDGHRRWTTTVIGPDPARAAVGDPLRASGSCRRVPEDATRVVCVVSDAVVVDDGTSVTAHAPTSRVHLVVVDPRTGILRADHRLGADLGTLDAVLPGGLAVTVSSRAGRASPEVVALDATSGKERWRTAAPALAQWGGFGVAAVGNAVAVIGGSGLDVVGADGSVRRSVPVSGYQGYVPLADGRIALPVADGTLVVGPDRDVKLAGTAMWTVSDDGSVAGLTLVRDGTLRAYDAGGRQLWELPGATPAGGVVLRGVVYVTRDGGVVAVQGSTGKVLWRTDLPVRQLSPVTDGSVLLVTLSTEAVALDLRTGAQLWRAALPPGHAQLMTVGGLLLAADQRSDTLVLG